MKQSLLAPSPQSLISQKGRPRPEEGLARGAECWFWPGSGSAPRGGGRAQAPPWQGEQERSIVIPLVLGYLEPQNPAQSHRPPTRGQQRAFQNPHGGEGALPAELLTKHLTLTPVHLLWGWAESGEEACHSNPRNTGP